MTLSHFERLEMKFCITKTITRMTYVISNNAIINKKYWGG